MDLLIIMWKMWFLFALCGVVTVLSADGRSFNLIDTNSTYTEGDRYFYIPDDSGDLQFCDTQSSDSPQYIDAINKAEDVALYMLYTRNNTNSPQYIRTNDLKSLEESHFNVSKTTKVIAHGWGGNGNSNVNTIIKNAFLTAGDVNVIVVDWKLVASGIYVSACKHVAAVGRSIANLLRFMYGGGVSGAALHLVGHSLGGQVVGFAGRELEGQAARISSLDPALPLWGILSERLRRTDAKYVEVIHTNAGLAGQLEAIGDVDFYPNGGRWMAGCGLVGVVCSHSRSYEYFAESLNRNAFKGIKCKNVAQAQASKCNGKESMRMGNMELSKSGTGIFHLYTNAKPPYGRD